MGYLNLCGHHPRKRMIQQSPVLIA